MQVHVVERGLDLVHHVEGRRPAAEHGEQERQRGERPLATRQQRQLAHVLARRPGLDLDAGVEQVVGIGEPRAGRVPPGNSVSNSVSKFSATSANAAANTSTISSSIARMTLASSRRWLFTSSSWASRNSWRSWSASNSSSASGLIGPMSRSSRSSSRTRAGGVTPSGERAGTRGHGGVRARMSRSRRSASTAVSRRSRVSASSSSARLAALAHLVERALGRGPLAGAAPSSRAATARAASDCCGAGARAARPARPRRPSAARRRGVPAGRRRSAGASSSTRRCLGGVALGDVARRAAPRPRPGGAQQPSTLATGGAADLDVGARAPTGGPLVDALRAPPISRPRRALGLVGLERRQQRLELVDPGLLAVERARRARRGGRAASRSRSSRRAGRRRPC